MSQNNVYNVIPGKKDSEKLQIAGDTQVQNKTAHIDTEFLESEISSENAGKTNVIQKGKKTVKEFTFQNLEGDIEIIPTPKNFRIVPGMTVRIIGVGKYLSGFYFVMSRQNAISSSGAMTIRLSVIKTNFGDSLKGEPPVNIEYEDLIGDKDSLKSGGGDDISYPSQPDYVDKEQNNYPENNDIPVASSNNDGGGFVYGQTGEPVE